MMEYASEMFTCIYCMRSYHIDDLRNGHVAVHSCCKRYMTERWQSFINDPIKVTLTVSGVQSSS
jgi:hypothetical protein